MSKLRDVAKLSAMIMSFVPPLAPFAPLANKGADLIPQGDDSNDEHAWKASMVPTWMKKCGELMDLPMSNDVRGRVLRDKIDSDWFKHYGERAKRSFINKLAEDVVFAVKADMAADG